MRKRFGENVPVYTVDSVTTKDDDKKKQVIIDKWTDGVCVCVCVSMNILCDDSANVSTSAGWGKWERVEEGAGGCRICGGLGQRGVLRNSLRSSL